MVIKVIMLVVFFGIMIGVGFYARKQATDVNGFVLGGRSVGPWLTAFAYGTSYFSAVIFIGYAGQFGWKYGIASTWIGIGNAILGSLLAWVVLGRRTRLITQKLDSRTMPEFFERRYNSKSMKIISSWIIFIFLIPYTASLYNGLSRLFGMAFDIDYKICVVAMAVLTGIYVIVGGYMATAINDFIQGIIMLFGICAVIAAVLQSKGGFTEAMHSLAEVQDPEATTMNGAFASFLGPDPLNLLGVVVLTSLGTWGLPQMIGKFYAIKSDLSPADVCQQVNKGTTTFSEEYRELADKIIQLLPYAQNDPYAFSYNDACTAFARGESAMYCIGSYAVPQILSVNPDMQIDSFVFPANDNADKQVLNSGVDLQFSVMKDCKNKEAAYEVLQFMLEDENIQIYLDEQNAVPCKEGDFELPSMLDGVKEYIENDKMTDYQDHHYPSEMAVDAMIQTYLMDGNADSFLAKFDKDWIRYNRDLIRKVQKYEEEHGEGGNES